MINIFLGGLISFFSPCILPVLPLYIGYLSGNDLNNKKKIMINTIFFVLGISFAFVILALGFSSLGRLLYNYKSIISKISGGLVILLGLFQLGFLKSNFLSRDRKFYLELKKMNIFIAFLLGFTFSFAWTPCIGPTLSGILFAISNMDNLMDGIIMMGIYTLGFTLPFLLTGFFSSYLLKLFKKYMFIVKYTQIFMGIMLIMLGILILFNKLNLLLTL